MIKSIKQVRLAGKSIGLQGLVDSIINEKNKWSVKKYKNLVGSGNTNKSSISDYEDYKLVCKLAATNEKIFSKFKSCREYQDILEHVSYEQGIQYLNLLENLTEEIDQKTIGIIRQDIGKPPKYSYGKYGRISPTNLRYATVTKQLFELFGSLDSFIVSEIGVGYGGQASQICLTWGIKKYNIYDLNEVIPLAKKYLVKVCEYAPIESPDPCTEIYSDLIISNYAFSELKREVQDIYIRNVVLNSKRGYLIYNSITPKEWKSYTALEFSNLIPGSQILEETPNTFSGNVLVVWGHKKH